MRTHNMNKVVVSAIIRNSEGKVLVIHLSKEKNEGVIVPPGGKIELNENARECVVRECKEELAIDIKVNKLVGISEIFYGETDPWLFIYYEAEIVNGTPTPMEPNKILSTKWVDLDQIEQYENIRWV